MHFNPHFDLAGKHAFLSASKYHWINYDDEKLDRTYRTALAAARGTALHEFAMTAIKLGIRQQRGKQTLSSYVNDAIGFRMTPEQTLYFSDNCFGTADAISFRNNLLRIHDLKTGVIPGSMNQLMVYAALFCLEYGVKPAEIQIELRIYQNDDIQRLIPEPHDVIEIMVKLQRFDAILNDIRREDLS